MTNKRICGKRKVWDTGPNSSLVHCQVKYYTSLSRREVIPISERLRKLKLDSYIKLYPNKL